MRTISVFALIALAACAPKQWPEAAPAPKPAPTPTPAPATPTPVVRVAPHNWHLLDATADGVPGISLLRAERELLANKRPARTVIVAVIDNGIDTMHTALRPRLWTNEKEIGGNGRDDDNNGFVDDLRGWNLLGSPDGRIIKEDTYELTRLVAQCRRPAGRDSLRADYRNRCPEFEQQFTKKRNEIDQTLANIRQIDALYAQILPMLRRAVGTDSLTVTNVTALTTANDTVRQARAVFLQLASQGITPAEVETAKKAYESQARFGFNLDFDPRPIIGDRYPDTTMKRYGNSNVTGPGGEHGTHVSGIVASIRGSGMGANGDGVGIAQSVRIMAIRAVPEGDERDKDIANAIRYAVDNGANIINMSFGKGHSPYKKEVDDAVKYADSKGVLMVHASGNEGADVTKSPSFPTPIFLDGGRARNWIEVGATTWRGGDTLAANFSNWASSIVDIFAPGDDINSTVPGGGFKENSGTSMASPVVAGVAALLMSYYPNLTATDVKRIILESAAKYGDKVVQRPGEGAPIRFSELSATGGVVNVYNAVKMAEQMAATRP
jgi:subtilisin family serine protease